MNEALDDILTESGDEEEENAIVNQVLDEIGIEVAAKVLHTAKKVHFNYLMTIFIFKVSDAPSAPKSKVGTKTAATNAEDKEIEDLLAQLKAWMKRRRRICD